MGDENRRGLVRKKLTDLGIAALTKPAKGREFYADDRIPELMVSVTETGAKSFVLYTRYPPTNAPARRSLGKVGHLSLADAREKALRWLALIKKGIDPKEEEVREREARIERQQCTFEHVAEEYLKRHQMALPPRPDGQRPRRGEFPPPREGAKRKAEEVARDVRKHLIPALGKRPVSEVRLGHVVRVIEGIVDRGSPHQARNILKYARQILGWAARRGTFGIDRSPCERIKLDEIVGTDMTVGDRVLTDEEMAALWRATAGALDVPPPHSREKGASTKGGDRPIGYPMGPMIRMLMLTGQRRGEVAGARWGEFADLDDAERATWIIPGERYKSKQTHHVPLTTRVLEILGALPRQMGGDAVFSSTGGSLPINGFSKAKADIDRVLERELGRKPPRWTIHDIRRTVRTGLARVGTDEVVAEMVIGHDLKGLLKTYNKHDYMDRRRRALEAWEAHLMSIVEPSPASAVEPPPACPPEALPSNVVPFRRAVSA